MSNFFGRPGTTQTVAYTGTAGTVTNGAGAQVSIVRVVASSDAFISFSGDATTSDVFMAAGIPEYFVVTPGQKVSAIQSSAGGNLYVTEMV